MLIKKHITRNEKGNGRSAVHTLYCLKWTPSIEDNRLTLLVVVVSAVGRWVLLDAAAHLSLVLVLFGQSLSVAPRVSGHAAVCLLFQRLRGGLVRVRRVKELVKALGKNPIPTDAREEIARRVGPPAVAVQGLVLENDIRPAAGGLEKVPVHELVRWVVRRVISPVVPFAWMIKSIIPEGHFSNRLDLRDVGRVREINLTRSILWQKRGCKIRRRNVVSAVW